MYGGAYSAVQANWGDSSKPMDTVSAATGFAGGANQGRGGYGTLDDSGRTRGRDHRGGHSVGNCFTCGQPGHKSSQCTSQDKRPQRTMQCWRCHQEGHIARNCPSLAGGDNMVDGGSAYKRARGRDDEDDDGGYSRKGAAGNAPSMGGAGMMLSSQVPIDDAWQTGGNNEMQSSSQVKDWNQGEQGSSGW